MSHPPPQQRLRITFGKSGKLIYAGHLDMARLWERTARRARLPLAYSHGFNPRPRLQLADALPLGMSSTSELADLWMQTPVEVEGLPDQLRAAAPPGLEVYKAKETDLKGPALQTLIDWADYTIAFTDSSPDDLAERVRNFLEQTHVVHERRGKTYNLRPLVHSLHLGPQSTLHTRLSLGARGTARPQALLDALGLGDAETIFHRDRLHLRTPS